MTLKELIRDSHQIAVNHGFWRGTSNFGEKVALMHSELSEMFEGYRRGELPDEHCPQFSNVEVEAADVIIRLCDAAGAYGWNLEGAIRAKMDYNGTRPYRHGKKC